MSLKIRYKDNEIVKSLHPCISGDFEFTLQRYEVAYKGGQPEYVVLELVSDQGEVKKLKFSHPEFDVFSRLRVPVENELGPIYIVDKTKDGYEDSRALEVGYLKEDSEPFFWAAKVEIIS